jgi:hypothetical protein
MNTLILSESSTAQWWRLVTEAEQKAQVNLSEDSESYLVFLLMRYSDNPEIMKSILAIDFLKSLNALGEKRLDMLREVGDKCLILSGLFPGRARSRRVRISYFVKLGQTAYSCLSQASSLAISKLYANLGEQFVGLMDVLHTMRELTSEQAFLDLLQAEELWQDTKSSHALKTLRASTQGFFLRTAAGAKDSAATGRAFKKFNLHSFNHCQHSKH